MTLQNIPDLMAGLTQLNDHAVQNIRKTTETPPRVSVFDVLQAVTGYPDDQSRGLYRRLLAAHPEVGAACTYFKFPGRGQRDTPVTDAQGIIQIIMLLPGKTAATARQYAANVVVRYLGGDMSLVQEVMTHRQVQAELDPEHPASIFGQSVPVATPCETPRAEVEQAKNSRIQALSAALQLARAINSTSQGRLQVEAQKAIDNVLLPLGESAEQFVDAAAILRERAHSEEQIARLAGELGKDLKLIAEHEQICCQSNEQTFGADRCQVGWYHRVRQASLIEDVLESFKQRSLYHTVMSGQPSGNAARRQGFLSVHGRGRRPDRSRSVRRI